MNIPPDQHPFFDAHEEAMDLAVRAESRHAEGRSVEATTLYARAIEAEQRALAAVPPDKLRTRAVIYKSIESLRLKERSVQARTEGRWIATPPEHGAYWLRDGDCEPALVIATPFLDMTSHEVRFVRAAHITGPQCGASHYTHHSVPQEHVRWWPIRTPKGTP